MHSTSAVFARVVLSVMLALSARGLVAAEDLDRQVPPGMVWIAGGEFHMGSTSELARRDLPREAEAVLEPAAGAGLAARLVHQSE